MSSDGSTDFELRTPKGKVAVVWKHFRYRTDASSGKIKNTGKATCKICKMDISHCGGTTNLWNYLRASHFIEYVQCTFRNGVQQQTIDHYTSARSVEKLSQLKNLQNLSLNLLQGT